MRPWWDPGLLYLSSTFWRHRGETLQTCFPLCFQMPHCPHLPEAPTPLTCAALAAGSCCRVRTSPSGLLRNSGGEAGVSIMVSFVLFQSTSIQKVKTVLGWPL